MYDGFKLELQKYYKEILLKNENLDWKTTVSKHGEILEQKAIYPTGAINPLLYFEIKNNYIEVKGSFHKYFENGTNCNHYSYAYFKATLNDFNTKFGIGLDAIVHNLEFGLNIELPKLVATEIIQACMLYKCYEFNTEYYKNGINGIMKSCKLKQYIVKIYDKGLQQNNTSNLLRIEKKFIKMQRLGKSITLSTLLESKFIKDVSNHLLEMWNDVILHEPNVEVKKLCVPMQKIYHNWSDINYIRRLVNTEKRKFKYERSRLKKIISENCTNSKHKLIYETMFEQLIKLEKTCTKITAS